MTIISRKRKRLLAQGSAATLGYIVGNIPGANVGQAAAGRAFDYVYGNDAPAVRPSETGMVVYRPMAAPRPMAIPARVEANKEVSKSGGKSLSGMGKVSKKEAKKYVKKRNAKGSKKGRSSKKFKTRKQKKSSIVKLDEKNGITIMHENSGVLNNVTYGTQYLGHSTVAHRTLIRAAFMAMVKKLCIKAGLDVTDTNQYIGNLASLGAASPGVKTNIQVWYSTGANQTQEQGQTDAQNLSVAETGIYNQSFNNVCNTLYSTLTAAWNENYQLMYATIFTVTEIGLDRYRTPLATISLTTGFFEISVVSLLKYQNRTVRDAGDADQALQVDRQPLCGKEYLGKGNGVEITLNGLGTYVTGSSSATIGGIPVMYAQRDSGTILQSFEITPSNVDGGFTDASANNMTKTLNEPMSSKYLSKVKSSKNVVVQSGDLMVNKLVMKQRFGIKTLTELLKAGNVAQGTRLAYGNFAILGLEKMIKITTQSEASKESSKLILAYEHEYRCNAVYKEKKVYGTMQRVESSAFQPPHV